jgi:hypothetical protein
LSPWRDVNIVQVENSGELTAEVRLEFLRLGERDPANDRHLLLAHEGLHLRPNFDGELQFLRGSLRLEDRVVEFPGGFVERDVNERERRIDSVREVDEPAVPEELPPHVSQLGLDQDFLGNGSSAEQNPF